MNLCWKWTDNWKNLGFLCSENQTRGAHEKSWFIDRGSEKAWNTVVGKAEDYLSLR